MGRKLAIPVALPMTELQESILQKITSRHSTGQQISKRANILLFAAQQQAHCVIIKKIGVSINTVKTWRNRWCDFHEELCLITAIAY